MLSLNLNLVQLLGFSNIQFINTIHSTQVYRVPPHFEDLVHISPVQVGLTLKNAFTVMPEGTGSKEFFNSLGATYSQT